MLEIYDIERGEKEKSDDQGECFAKREKRGRAEAEKTFVEHRESNPGPLLPPLCRQAIYQSSWAVVVV